MSQSNTKEADVDTVIDNYIKKVNTRQKNLVVSDEMVGVVAGLYAAYICKNMTAKQIAELIFKIYKVETGHELTEKETSLLYSHPKVSAYLNKINKNLNSRI